MDENVREKLLHASSPEEVLAIIDHADDEATKEEEAEAEAQQVAAAEQSSLMDQRAICISCNCLSNRYCTYIYGT